MSIGLQEQARNAVLGMINKLSTEHCDKLFKELAIDKQLCFKLDCEKEIPNIQGLDDAG